jgi:hypothetical protein
MRPMTYAYSAALLFAISGCSSINVDESIGESSEALNGTLVPSSGFLTKKAAQVGSPDEATRRLDTGAYYTGVATRLGMGLPADLSISPGLGTLMEFRTTYGFGSGNIQLQESSAFYYNSGDLGLGREMHCVDRLAIDRQVACYVTNFAAGDDEFTFGLSPDIAFTNMNATPQRVLATVAMVFRQFPPAGSDPILFMAYNETGALADNAPLDRHGINFAKAFNGSNPDPTLFGTPGVNFNNHIPSNCLSCHGGVYVAGNHSAPGALFLPWDLDQFQYQETAGRTRASQEGEFRKLNDLARRVEVLLRGTGQPIANQIDGWYGNTEHSPSLSGNFEPAYVPDGWKANAPGGDPSAYFNVVRRSCRGCHIATGLPFDDAASFLNLANPVTDPNNPSGPPLIPLVDDLVGHTMPHALQAQREFWLSSQPVQLESYLRAQGKTVAADRLHAQGGPGTIVTLDPPQIHAVLN